MLLLGRSVENVPGLFLTYGLATGFTCVGPSGHVSGRFVLQGVSVVFHDTAPILEAENTQQSFQALGH